MTEPSEHILRVGLTFNLKRDGGDHEAEFDTPRTIDGLTSALESLGHTVIPLEANATLPSRLVDAQPDVVFNIAEGSRGRSREAQVPALLEFLGIPYTGSDPTTLSVCHDKALAKTVLRAAGIRTPEGVALVTGEEALPPLRYPLMVKPNAEGASKGISASSVVFDEASARAEARRLIERYGGSALVEEYIQGRELTVGLLAEPELRVLPPLEYVFLDRREYPVYGYYEKQDWRSTMRFDCPADLTEDERASIAEATLRAFTALGCRDMARFDTRLTKGGEVYVIECNPIPGIAPDWSDMSSIATAAGLDYRTLVRDILAGSIKRYRARPRAS